MTTIALTILILIWAPVPDSPNKIRTRSTGFHHPKQTHICKTMAELLAPTDETTRSQASRQHRQVPSGAPKCRPTSRIKAPRAIMIRSLAPIMLLWASSCPLIIVSITLFRITTWSIETIRILPTITTIITIIPITNRIHTISIIATPSYRAAREP